MVSGQISKNLVIYELDLGINTVVWKHCDPVPESAHRLITVPGGTEGPGGVLVVCENLIIYKKVN